MNSSRRVSRKRTLIFSIVVIITSVISFMAGKIVESTHHHYTKRHYEQQVWELEEQLATYRSEMRHYRSKSDMDSSGDIDSLNWTEVLEKINK